MSAESTEVITSYEPTEQERSAQDAHAAEMENSNRFAAARNWVKVKIPHMEVDHPSVMAYFGDLNAHEEGTDLSKALRCHAPGSRRGKRNHQSRAVRYQAND